jgi:hypothetical protein
MAAFGGFKIGREESLDGMRKADIMGCLYRRARRTKMGSKRHITTWDGRIKEESTFSGRRM